MKGCCRYIFLDMFTQTGKHDFKLVHITPALPESSREVRTCFTPDAIKRRYLSQCMKLKHNYDITQNTHFLHLSGDVRYCRMLQEVKCGQDLVDTISEYLYQIFERRSPI